MKTKEILAKNANNFKIGRVSLSSNIETKLENLIETPLPVPPQEINLTDSFSNSCQERSCKAMYEAQIQQNQKLQNLCQMYYQHIQSLHDLVQ